MTDKQTVKFGDICREVKLTTKDPIADGYERYIGLEHLDSGSLKIKRWGMIAEDNPSFTRVFKKGHILFGKRRPYLKKAAIAEFDGICSGDIVVLESKGHELDSELLPFLIQSNQFWSWAVQTSSGSLSPRTKFSALKDFEFTCPSESEQASLVKMANNLSALESIYGQAISSAKRVIDNILGYRVLDGWKKEPLKKLIEVCIDYRGKSPPKSTGGIPLITAKNIRAGYIDEEPREYIPYEDFSSWMTRGLPLPGDILFTTEAPLGNIALSPQYKFALGQRTVCFRANSEKISSKTLFWILQSKYFSHWLKSRTTGTTAQGVKVKELLKLEVYYPTGEAAEKFESTLEAFSEVISQLEKTKAELPSISNMFG